MNLLILFLFELPTVFHYLLDYLEIEQGFPAKKIYLTVFTAGRMDHQKIQGRLTYRKGH